MRSAYEAFRRNVGTLAGQIQRDLPQLTLHDASHLDALWVVADLIAGPEYPITPAEAFVFGGAILLHDAGHALATIRGGLPALKSTPEWKDTTASMLESISNGQVGQQDIDNPPSHLIPDILFSVLRNLHGRTAEQLAFMEVDNPATGGRLNILEDNSLRMQYGHLIGQIAASHNWEPEDIPIRLQHRVGAIAGLPNTWIIDPVKLACLLRCADAAQIDQQRAPDFLFALLKLRGISAEHWLAQNKLAQPFRDPDDANAMLFSSTGGYNETDADAWWVAFDLINIVNRELRSCDTLMRDTGRPLFSINRVRDADDPGRLAAHVKTVGWTPIQAEIRVTQAAHVANSLGGEALYGPNPSVPLRELIQNAADAIRARRQFEVRNDSYIGSIVVRLRREATGSGEHTWLDVEDNGIGMSERVLTGPLLDFGTSLWRNSLMEREYPGLKGKHFRPGGIFGIGFYSVFMIADYVAVASKRFDEGLDRGRMLIFRNRLNARPLLLKRLPETFSTSTQTVVSIRLEADKCEENLSRLLSVSAFLGSQGSAPLTLKEVVAKLAPTVDCNIYTSEFGAATELAHSEKWHEQDGATWLQDVLVNSDSADKKQRALLLEASSRLSLIREGSAVLGRAAIALSAASGTPSLSGRNYGFASHGGLHSLGPGPFGLGSDAYIGVIDCRPRHASRYSFSPASLLDLNFLFSKSETRDAWLKDQLSLLPAAAKSGARFDAVLSNCLRFGHVIRGRTFLRCVWRGVSYTKLEEVPLVAIEDLDMEAGQKMVFLSRPNRDGGIVTLAYYNKRQFEELRRIMTKYDLDRVYFSTRFDGDWNRIPEEIGLVSNMPTLLGAVTSALTEKGIHVSMTRVVVPQPDKRRMICTGLLVLEGAGRG